MIAAIRRALFRPRFAYTDPIDQQRASIIMGLTFIIFWLSAATVVARVSGIFANSGGAIGLPEISNIVASVMAAASWWLARQGRLASSSYAMVLTFFGVGGYAALNGISDILTVTSLLVVIASGVVLNRRELAIVTGLTLLLMAIGAVAPIGTQFEMGVAGQFLTLAAVAIATALLLSSFTTSLNIQARQFSLTLRATQRVSNLAAEANLYEDEDSALRQVLDAICTDLGYSAAQVYLMNTDATPYRRYGRTASGIVIEEAIESLPRGNAVLQAALSDQPQQVTEADLAVRRQHLLPTSRSGIALPLRYDDRLLGVLDVQSTQLDAFATLYSDTLRLLATQLSSIMGRVRLIAALRSDLNASENLVRRQQEQLGQLQSQETQRGSLGWQAYLQGQGSGVLGYDLDLQTGAISRSEALPLEIARALDSEEILIEGEGDQQRVLVPIRLNEQTLGALSFRLAADAGLTPRQRDMIENIAQRLAVALDNRRLFEESQARAYREATASAFGQLLMGTSDLEEVLQQAADGITAVMGTVRTRISLTPQQNTPAPRRIPDPAVDPAEADA